MVKEYCDKCKREISREDTSDWNGKKDVEVSYIDNRSSFGDRRVARVTLCRNCFEDMRIDETVKRIRSNAREEKEPAAVDRLLDIIRELVAECLDQ